ncbi:TPM domain-containing protein [bacterium]|nr:MAG: TPM domain-containing protein [bacterium]
MGRGRKALLAILLLALASLGTLALAAFQIPESPSGRVSDYAGLLKPEEARELEAQLARIETSNSNQFTIAIFPGLEGESLEDLSIRIGDKWKIGQKGRDNGLMLLIFMAEKKVRVEVGKGLEGAITDLYSGRVIREIVAPAFRDGKPGEGLSKAMKAFDEASRGEFTALPKKEKKDNSFPVIFFLLFFIFLFISGLRRRGSNEVLGRRGGGMWMGGPFIGGGRGGGGFGGFGGFGGGGGGFGGGGSSGGW